LDPPSSRSIAPSPDFLFLHLWAAENSWGKIAEHKMHVCARALENGNITTIPFVLVNYAEFYEFGNKVEVLPTTMIRYAAYVDGQERQSTGNSAELEGLVTGIL